MKIVSKADLMQMPKAGRADTSTTSTRVLSATPKTTAPTTCTTA